MMKRTKRHQQLTKLICIGGTALAASLLAMPAEAAITTSHEFTESSQGTTNVTDDINIADGFVKVALAHTGEINYTRAFNFTGDINIANSDLDGYALFNQNSDRSGGISVLSVNPYKDQTVQLSGNVKAEGNDVSIRCWADVTVNLSNEESYLAGKLVTNEHGHIKLDLSDGATWYVQQDDNEYSLYPGTEFSYSSAGVILKADGGVIDLYHQSPTTVRSSAANKTFTLNHALSSFDGATFAISSDIANNQADKVVLNGVEGSNNTYYVQVVYDASELTDGTYTGEAVVLTTNDSSDTVVAKAYTTTKDTNAGLLTKTLTLTPTLSSANGTTKLTEVKVEGNGSSTGPAQLMAQSAGAVGYAGLSTWRLENNDLLRRMGDLRQDEGKAGVWGRVYGGENEVNTSSAVTVKAHGIQVGYDRPLELANGKVFTGVAVSHMEGDISSASGSGDTDSTMVGVYGSYQGKRGHFADAIIKYGRLSNELTSYSGTDKYSGDSSANGWNMCLEYGYHKELDKGWYLEPQAELSYGHIEGNSYTMRWNDAAGASVNNDAIDSVIGRIGVNYGRDIGKASFYTKLSLVHEFAGDMGVRASYGGYDSYVKESMKDTWLEYGIGFNQTINDRNNLYGEITRTAGADKITEKWKANIGFRHSF